MIELHSVGKVYQSQTALYPLDLKVDTGSVTALIGPSGCGKSTLLRLVAGLIDPTTGAVTFDGQPVNRDTVIDIRRRMGYVIQDGGLFPHFTAEQNVLLMGRKLNRNGGELAHRLHELCELTRFPPSALGRYPVELSGGQRQRVSLMRALMLKPAALLLDEPLGALDPLVRASLQVDLNQIFETLKQTVLLVTHDMAEAAYLADTIVLLREGVMVQKGSLEDLRSSPAEPWVSEFINAQRSLVQL